MTNWHSRPSLAEPVDGFGVESTTLPKSASQDSEVLAFREGRRWRMELLEQTEAQIGKLQMRRDTLRKEVAALDSLLGCDTVASSVARLDAEDSVQSQTDSLAELDFGNDNMGESRRSPSLSESVEATVSLLRQHGKPLHYREIYTIVVNMGVHVPGKDPAATLLSRFSRDPRIERVGSGTYKALPDIVANESL